MKIHIVLDLPAQYGHTKTALRYHFQSLEKEFIHNDPLKERKPFQLTSLVGQHHLGIATFPEDDQDLDQATENRIRLELAAEKITKYLEDRGQDDLVDPILRIIQELMRHSDRRLR